MGISRVTVSNACNRPDQLSAELRERILEGPRDLGFAGPAPPPASRPPAVGGVLLAVGSANDQNDDLLPWTVVVASVVGNLVTIPTKKVR